MKTFARFAWVPAILASLAISTYSLFWVARMWGLPPLLAAGVSTVFDGAALTFADLALRYARTHGDSGLAPRLAVLILAGLSAYLNSWHAVLSGDPFAARILYATPPVVSIALFELHTRWERRAALRRAGRVPAALPVFGRWAWVLFPIRTLRALRSVVAFRLETITEASGVLRGTAASEQGTAMERGKRDRSGADGRMETRKTERVTSADTRTMRDWGRLQGFSVPERGPLSREIVSAYQSAMNGSGTLS